MSRINQKNKFLLLAATLSLMWLLPTSGFALDQPSFGGNNASDYQPPTGNPQNNTSTSLQLTNTTLQPVTLLNQQALIQSGGLSVLTAPDKGATSTAADPVTAKKPRSALPTWIVGGLLTLAAVGYILFKPDKKPEAMTVEPTPVEEQPKTTKPKASKKPAKKASRKKRKTARR